MKASVQYTDFKGTAAADISDALGGFSGDDISGLAKYFNLDETRFTPVGLTIYGTENFYVSLLCVDKERSNDEKEYIVKMSCQAGKDVLDRLFKRLQVVLYDKFDEKYPKLDYDEEARYEDFHETDEE